MKRDRIKINSLEKRVFSDKIAKFELKTRLSEI